MHIEDPAPGHLGISWEAASLHAERYVSDAQRRATRWGWSSLAGALERYEPHWEARSGQRPGAAKLTETPRRPAKQRHYGLEEDGRIALVFEYRSTLDAPNAVAVNHSAAGGEVQLRYEGGPGKWELSALSVAERDSAGRIVGVRNWMMTLGSLGCVSERYVFANAAVTTADIERRLPYADSPEHWRLEFHYDEVGELSGIDRLDDEGSSVIYRPARASQVREAERYLTGAIDGLAVRWARRQQDSPSAYAFAVVYDPNASRPLPPALALGTAIDLQRLSGIERWRAPEFAVFDPEPDEFLADDRFADACAIVNVDIKSTLDRGRPKALAESWAKQLRNIDWNRELGSSSGAIAVYTMELECDDLDAAVDRLIDAPTRARVESE